MARAITDGAGRRGRWRTWLVRLAWLCALWVAGVATVGLAAWLLKAVLLAAGLQTP